jgi:hypothetical protein
MRAFKTNIPISLDGDLVKWRGADTVTFEGKPLAGHPRHATVCALWDKGNLYLAFDVHSSKLQASVRERDGDKLWEDDGVEFLIDALSHRTKEFLPDDFSYHINIFNTVYDDPGNLQRSPILGEMVMRNTQCESWMIITMSYRCRFLGGDRHGAGGGHTFLGIVFA